MVALSIAEAYSEAAALVDAVSLAVMAASSRFRNVLRRVLVPRLRSVKRTVLRAALIADLVLAMVDREVGAGQKLKRPGESQGYCRSDGRAVAR